MFFKNIRITVSNKRIFNVAMRIHLKFIRVNGSDVRITVSFMRIIVSIPICSDKILLVFEL